MLGFLGKVSLKGTNQGAVPLNKNISLSQIEGCSYLDSAKMTESVTSHFSWTASGFFNERVDKSLGEQNRNVGS